MTCHLKHLPTFTPLLQGCLQAVLRYCNDCTQTRICRLPSSDKVLEGPFAGQVPRWDRACQAAMMTAGHV